MITIDVDTPHAVFAASKGIQQKQERLMRAVEAHIRPHALKNLPSLKPN